MSSSFLKTNLVGGSFQDNQGNVLSNGWLTFQLSHDANVAVLGSPTGSQVTAGQITTMLLNQNGSLCPLQYIWTNDVLTPAGSYYLVTAYNSQGLQVWANKQIMYIQPYTASINIGTITPNTP